jgi:hypothetical protein
VTEGSCYYCLSFVVLTWWACVFYEGCFAFLVNEGNLCGLVQGGAGSGGHFLRSHRGVGFRSTNGGRKMLDLLIGGQAGPITREQMGLHVQ